MEYILDYIVIGFIVLFILFGLTKNPIRSLIHLILYILLTFILSGVISELVPNIVSSFGYNIDDLGATIANFILDINNALTNLGEELDVTLKLIPKEYSDSSYYSTLILTLSKSICFIIGSIVSYFVSLLLSVIINLIIKAILKNKEINYKKRPYKVTSVVLNLVFGFFFISFTFSPYNRLVNNCLALKDNLRNNLDYIDTNLISEETKTLVNDCNEIDTQMDSLLDRISGLVTYIDTLNETFNTYRDDLDEIYDLAVSLESEISAKESTVTSTQNKAKLIGYKASANEIIAQYNTYISDIDAYKEDINEYVDTLSDASSDLKEAKEELSAVLNTINTYLEQIETYIDTANEYLDLVDSYSQYAYINHFFSFMTNINYGFENNFYLNLTEEFNNIEATLDTIVKENTDILSEKIDVYVATYGDSVGTLKEALTEINDTINEYEPSINNLKEDIGNSILTFDTFIESSKGTLEYAINDVSNM